MIPGLDVRTYFAKLGRMVARRARQASDSPWAEHQRIISSRLAGMLQKAGISLRPFKVARLPKRVPGRRSPLASAPNPRTGRNLAQQKTVRDPMERYRRQLSKAFTMAHEREQIDFALSLLEQGLSPAKIVRLMASVPMDPRPRGGLPARIAARDALSAATPKSIDIGTPQDHAAEMITAYEKALSR